MRNFNYTILLFAALLLFNACLKEAEMDPPMAIDDALALCDSLQPTVSFANDIVPALTNYGCYNCHSTAAAPYAGNSIVLEGYPAFSAEAERVLGSVSGDEQFTQMPLGNPGVVDANTIQQLECWILRGKNDN